MSGTVTIDDAGAATGSGSALALYNSILAIETAANPLPDPGVPDADWGGTAAEWWSTFLTHVVRVKRAWAREAQAHADNLSGADWITACNIDYVAAATQALASNGTYTIAGVVHTKINSAADSVAMTVTNGAGLVQKPVAASAYNVGARTAPGVTVALAAIIPAFYPGMRIRVWARLSYANMGASSQDLPYLVVEPGTSTTLSYLTDNYNDGAKRQQSFIAHGGTNGGAVSDNTNATDDILMVEAIVGEPFMHSRSGLWAAGWPAITAMHERHHLQATPDVANAWNISDLGAAAWGVLLACGRNGSGNALEVTWKNLRVDYKQP